MKRVIRRLLFMYIPSWSPRLCPIFKLRLGEENKTKQMVSQGHFRFQGLLVPLRPPGSGRRYESKPVVVATQDLFSSSFYYL